MSALAVYMYSTSLSHNAIRRDKEIGEIVGIKFVIFLIFSIF